MDAHVFRRIGSILCQTLHGARLERIHEPSPGITAFSLYVSGRKKCLFCRAHRSSPLLFLTDKSPLPNPAFPPAFIMRLRKYAEGRILGEARINWVERRLAFALPAPADASPNWLLLDCAANPSILHTLPENFSKEPSWPELAELPGLLSSDAGDPNPPWNQYRLLTPLLRRTLVTLDHGEQAALMIDLQTGQGDLFWYSPAGSAAESPPNAPALVSAWPLPRNLAGNGELSEAVTPATPEAVLPRLEAMQKPVLLEAAKTTAVAPDLKRDKSAFRRRARLLAKLDMEKDRLQTMLALGDDARLLQSHLWQLPTDARYESISVPLDPASPEGEARTIPLNSRLSVTDNMRIMFRKAAKASRGLAMLGERLALLRETPLVTAASGSRPVPPVGKQPPDRKKAFPPSLIQEFLSSDGFPLWRGRNAEGNRALLKLARPFDLWLHVEDGPSAHLLIRRDHAAHEVPERTLHEAGILVGLKSWRRNDPKATVMIALAKHVQPVKGAGPGTVRVQEQLGTIRVDIEETLEQGLRRPGA